METLHIERGVVDRDNNQSQFIEANTIPSSLNEIRTNHIIPVFVKDNEPVISHSEFIEATMDVISSVYSNEQVQVPSVRLSHPIKGRIPEAKYKPASELQDHEKTLYYERMAFVIEIPSIKDEIGGNELSLTIGGVKAYNLDNLYNKKGADEHFKVFVGFQNKVCTNLCVSTDGFAADIKVRSLKQLQQAITNVILSYNAVGHLDAMQELTNHYLTEQQFAHLIGRCRMYRHLPGNLRSEIPAIAFGDAQIGNVVKDYYKDNSFCRDLDGRINLWRLYNLFTNSNKSTYIDQFIDRSVSAFSFAETLKQAIQAKQLNWYLN